MSFIVFTKSFKIVPIRSATSLTIFLILCQAFFQSPSNTAVIKSSKSFNMSKIFPKISDIIPTTFITRFPTVCKTGASVLMTTEPIHLITGCKTFSQRTFTVSAILPIKSIALLIVGWICPFQTLLNFFANLSKTGAIYSL